MKPNRALRLALKTTVAVSTRTTRVMAAKETVCQICASASPLWADNWRWSQRHEKEPGSRSVFRWDEKSKATRICTAMSASCNSHWRAPVPGRSNRRLASGLRKLDCRATADHCCARGRALSDWSFRLRLRITPVYSYGLVVQSVPPRVDE